MRAIRGMVPRERTIPTKRELQATLASLGLPTWGLKHELVERLRQSGVCGERCCVRWVWCDRLDWLLA